MQMQISRRIAASPILELLDGMCEVFKRFDCLPEVSLPVKYPRTPGYRPPPEENPYNAW